MIHFHARQAAMTLAAPVFLLTAGFGQSAVRIVVPSGAAPPEQFAAGELARYAAAMGNPKPEVVTAPGDGDIYVGLFPPALVAQRTTAESQMANKSPDSFVVRSFGNKLVIFGNSPRANLFGAYYYL